MVGTFLRHSVANNGDAVVLLVGYRPCDSQPSQVAVSESLAEHHRVVALS